MTLRSRLFSVFSHTVNLLGNLPLKCLDVLLTPKVRPGSLEYMGVNMDAVSVLLGFLERRLDRVSGAAGAGWAGRSPAPRGSSEAWRVRREPFVGATVCKRGKTCGQWD